MKRIGKHLTLGNGETILFDGMLRSLLKWARRERPLSGQRDRLLDRPRVDLRNTAGQAGYHRDFE